MPRHFRLEAVSRSPARYDEAQLRHWQREAVSRATAGELVDWLGARLAPLGERARRERFATAVRGNILLPDDADALVRVVCPGDIEPAESDAAVLSEAGRGFFEQAIAALAATNADLATWTGAVASASGRRGAALYKPLRVALTGTTHGPELAPLVDLMGRQLATERLLAAARRSSNT